jgi:hypothetical protein
MDDLIKYLFIQYDCLQVILHHPFHPLPYQAFHHLIYLNHLHLLLIQSYHLHPHHLQIHLQIHHFHLHPHQLNSLNYHPPDINHLHEFLPFNYPNLLRSSRFLLKKILKK